VKKKHLAGCHGHVFALNAEINLFDVLGLRSMLYTLLYFRATDEWRCKFKTFSIDEQGIPNLQICTFLHKWLS
jgi:hypothetical protein